ncbi:MAG: hypothetical protein COT18_12715 [Elusimicrobia bacterium CG08_land_8_20_14_0_20_59_10]|nr:MAG: hypothetical protein COT18_12715 [Elusimicrobia bacterium CG08_land_8_20_14_0_20_59_10]
MTAHSRTGRTQPPHLPRSLTAVHFLPGDFAGARLENLEPAQYPKGVFFVKKPGRAARLTSGELAAGFLFTELLFSADVVFPKGGTLEAQAQVKTAGRWSPWFSFGRFTPGAGGRSVKSQENAFGKMDVDMLKLKKKASACRYRINILSAKGPAPVIKLAALVLSDPSAPYSAQQAAPACVRGGPLKLAVPRYSQMAQRVSAAGDICSPVSLAMVLTYLGRKTGPLGAVPKVRDAAGDIYGNWFFNTAHAGALGFYSFLARLNSLEEARSLVAAGIPVIASVTFGPGELRHSPIPRTRGHLLVIKGFDGRGNVIVNDPAAPGPGTVERVYDRAQFAAAWLKNKYGTCYIVARGLNSLLAVQAPVTDLFSRPPKTAGERGKIIESQLLQNERVELLEIRGRWARVKALEQASLKPGSKALVPYEGWLQAAALAFSLPLPPSAVVCSKKPGGISLGVKLCQPCGAALPARHLGPLPLKLKQSALRKKILSAARLFLGDKYCWGGRSAWGVDCSGLVNLCYRACGLDLPRNAHDQFAAARGLKKAALKPADLIFTTDSKYPDLMGHVMLYAGGGRLLEATQDSGTVREISFAKKFGTPFAAIKDGATHNGRRIFFGTLLP